MPGRHGCDHSTGAQGEPSSSEVGTCEFGNIRNPLNKYHLSFLKRDDVFRMLPKIAISNYDLRDTRNPFLFMCMFNVNVMTRRDLRMLITKQKV